MLTIVIDGIAFGMVLFVLSVGLSVTMGVMNVVNLAHGAFAMLGGYIAVGLVGAGWPFLATLPAAFAVAALTGLVAERGLYRTLYARPHLDQVLFSIGLVFMATAAATWFFGAGQRQMVLPDWLSGRVEIGPALVGRYRLFVILLCVALVWLLEIALTRTRFGQQLRAAVDDRRVARGLGIDVNRIFAISFVVGSGLAGLGGALAVELVGIDPQFALRFLVLMLIVVTLGGSGRLAGPFIAALVIGVADTMGKYLWPAGGAFIVYALMVALLVWRPHGLMGAAR